MSSRTVARGARRAADNPFRAERIEALDYVFPERPDEDGPERVELLLERFERLGRRGLLVGPHGSGKTTLLEELASRLAARGLRPRTLTLRTGEPAGPVIRHALAGLGPGDLLCVDGAHLLDRLARFRLARAARRAGAVLATAHGPGGPWPVLRVHRTSPGLLEHLLAELVEPAAARVLAPQLPDLLAAAGGDLRAVWRRLYDRWADGRMTE